MSWLRQLWSTFRSGRVRSDIDREVAFHLAERADDLRATGLSAADAERQARRQFGNVAAQSERVRDVHVSQWLETIVRNVRYAIRALVRAPGFTAAVVLTLALGIGANSAVFSALDAVVLRPLPFPEADRLVQIRQVQERSAETNIAPARLEDWQRLNTTFENITGYYVEDVADTSRELPEMIRRAFVSARFVDVWGVAPSLGRGFSAADHQPGGTGAAAVIVSDRYWRDRLGAAADAIGRSIRVGSGSAIIIGVMPATFRFPDRRVDLWSPVAIGEQLMRFRAATWYVGVGRLKRDATIEQARENLSAIQAELGRQYPDTDRQIGVALQPLKEAAIGNVTSSLWLLFGAVSVLLLITCTNVTALLLSRAAQRRQEVAIRLSLGATRVTLAGQMLTEATVVALAGGGLGLAAAALTSAAFRVVAGDIPRMDELAIDWRIVLYTLAITMTVALVCGVLPATRASRDGLAGATAHGGRTQVSGRGSLQWLLVGTQVALSVTLLAGAGLLVRSFQELSRVEPGFDASRILTFRISGSWAETSNYRRLTQRVDDTRTALRAVPGVESVATTLFLPGVPVQYETKFTLVEARTDRAALIASESRVVSPEYFETMGIARVAGEPCTQQPFGSAPDLLVNQSFASKFLASRTTPLGLHLAAENAATAPGRIVGVVGDARERGLDRDPGPVVYMCFGTPNPMPYFLVRTAGDPAALAQTVRTTIKAIDPLRAVYDLTPLDERLGGAFQENRLRMLLITLFAATALALASVGLYGTLSYAVSVRRREIGLRLALGAVRADIVRQYLIQGVQVAAIACACGVAAAVGVTRLLATMLYGVSPTDPITLASVVALVLGVAALAALVPATRAAWIEPVRALRND
ncbi:MAG TPA: ABC transporter permease [Vicinamibacterales bacterium]|nr:ABC transporter permease [Vicinamibacterales bacterium]